MSPPSEKVGGHVPRVPHQIAPMLNIRLFSTHAVVTVRNTPLKKQSCKTCKSYRNVVKLNKGPSINDVTLFSAKIYPLPPCHISSQVFSSPWNITSQFATPTVAITNFHLLCVRLGKNFICFIYLIGARCDKTNILFVKRRKYCTHC